MSFEASALLVTWMAILLLALVVSGLIRQVQALASGRVRVRANEVGLRPGTAAPEAARLAPHGERALLLFLSEGCGVCEEVLEEAAAQAAHTAQRGIAVLALFATPLPAFAQSAARGNGTGRVVVLAEESGLFERYQVPATPFAVAVDAAGRVARSEPVGSRQALQGLLDRTAASHTTPA
jgi:hypothetical protein